MAKADAPIRRILILKLDHIGDLLIAAPALMLLRNSFPDAHITLICAPWNAGLARRLGAADEIHCVNLYAAGPRELVRNDAIDRLRRLNLAPFDLAIDLRRDADTRDLLKLFSSRHKAGFGDLATFSFLDVAMPTPIDVSRHGPTRMWFGPADLDGGAGHLIEERGLRLTAAEAEVELAIWTDELWPPSDDGVDDVRALGAALWRVDVSTDGPDILPGDPEPPERAQVMPSAMRFDAHWLEGEPWGRWSTAHSASVGLRFPAKKSEIELLVRVQGHTSPSHPVAKVRVSAAGTEASHIFQAGDGPVALPLNVSVSPLSVPARSAPFLLHAGRYQADLRLLLDADAAWSPLVVKLQGARLGSVVALYAAPDTAPLADEGRGDPILSFDFDHSDSAEPLIAEISAPDPALARHIAIASLELTCSDLRAPLLPLSHIELKLLDLAAMVAIRFAPRLQLNAPHIIEHLLASPRADSSATEAVGRLERQRIRRTVLWPFLRRRQGRVLIGIGLGANKQTKLWPEKHFLALCRLLLKRPEVDLVFVGGPAEAEMVKRMTALLRAGERVLDLCQCCRIEDLGEVLAKLDGFVGLDTGTTHFAGRIGIRTVAIFGHAHDPLEWGPVGDNAVWVAADIPCRGCSFSETVQCAFGVACMTELAPEDAWPMVERHLFAAGGLNMDKP